MTRPHFSCAPSHCQPRQRRPRRAPAEPSLQKTDVLQAENPSAWRCCALPNKLSALKLTVISWMGATEPHGGYCGMSARFEGTEDYVATGDLKVAVNAAIALERPLLIKGEPGTGKTVLAYEVAKALNAPLLTWHIKSTTKAHQGLYEYDAVTRLRDSQLGEERVKDVRNYIKKGKLWEAFEAPQRPVLLIDEIDKADIEFPNDLLRA